MKTIRLQTIALGLATLLFAATTFAAPTKRDYSPKLKDYLGGRSASSLGLLDPSRMTVSHNVQMGYSSFGGGSLMSSLYATTIGYRISNPLTMSVTMGLSGNRLNMGGAPTTFNSIVGGARLDYRPTKDLHMSLEFAHLPGMYQSAWRNDPLGFSSGFSSTFGDSYFGR